MINALIISSLSERYYYDAFVKECTKLGVRVGILDPEHFVQTNGLMHIHLDSTNIQGYLEVVELGDDENSVQHVSLQDIRTAWYLRVSRTRQVSLISDVEERFKWNETLYALETVFSMLTCRWINSFGVIDRLACNKLLQQLHAAKVGLHTPQTVLSNIPHSVIKFSEGQGERLLLKSIGYVSLDPKDELVLYSEMFTSSELRESPEAIRACPVYAQEYIPKKFEYRVMIIGDEVLACRIDSQSSNKTLVDWRHYDFDNVEHIAVQLPPKVKKQLLCFMRSVGLTYGAIDLIETPSGEFVFLEVNPSGQWHWIEKLANLPIAESVARMLHTFVTK